MRRFVAQRRRPARRRGRTQSDLPGDLQQPHRAQAADPGTGAPADHGREAGRRWRAGSSCRSTNEVLWRAWEPMLFNQAHDLMSGVMTDRVYEDTIRSYDFSRRIAADEVRERWQDLGRADRHAGRGHRDRACSMRWAGRAPTSRWPTWDSRDGNVTDLSLIGPDGQEVPVQMVSSTRYASGGLLRAEIAFVARDVPPLGYAVYRLVPRPHRRPPLRPPSAADEPVPGERALPRRIRPGGRRDDAVARQGRQLGSPSRTRQRRGPGRGPRRPVGAVPAARRRQPHRHEDAARGAPARDRASSATNRPDPPGTVTRGPVFSEFSVVASLRRQGTFATTVRLYTGLRRIDIRTQILNQDQFVRYRVLFPTTIRDGQSVHEIPFGAIAAPGGDRVPRAELDRLRRRPAGAGAAQPRAAGQHRLRRDDDAVAPAQHADRGLRLRRRLRAGHVVRFGPGAGQGTSRSTTRWFRTPATGARRPSIARGWSSTSRCWPDTRPSHAGELPGRWGLLEITPHNVVLTALKPGCRTARCACASTKPTGVPTKATVRFSAPLAARAEEVNLMEDPGPACSAQDNTLQFDLRPFEIKTFKLRLHPTAEWPLGSN